MEKKIKEDIELSQFLICKSEQQMTKYSMKVEDIEINRNLYMQVIDEYMQKSELMVFWYGTDFEDLDEIFSRQHLMSYLKENINNPCLEIYLIVNCRDKV